MSLAKTLIKAILIVPIVHVLAWQLQARAAWQKVVKTREIRAEKVTSLYIQDLGDLRNPIICKLFI